MAAYKDLLLRTPGNKSVWTRPGVDGVGGGGGGVMAHAAEEHEQKTPQFIEPAAEEKNRGLNLYY